MASITTDKNTGRRRLQFVGSDGKRQTVRLGSIPKKAAETVKSKVEAILAAQFANVSADREVSEWLGGLDETLHSKLEAVGLARPRQKPEKVTLGKFLASYIALRSDVKGATALVYGHTKRNLIDYFGATKALGDITPGDCDAWRIWLGKNEKLADNTVKRRCAIARQFFRAALRDWLLTKNPFAEMKGLTVRGNRARDFNVTPEMAQRVLDACPDAEWRLLFALARYGGLRCPTECLALKWSDIDWANSRITIRSSKTAHHENGGIRVIPLFKELRPHLEAVRELAQSGAEWVITSYRGTNQNLRTQLNRIVRRAGLEPWTKPFQNLRATRETELMQEFDLFVACEWIGNSAKVAAQHYLQVTKAHLEQATQKATQQAAAPTSKPLQAAAATNAKGPALPSLASSCDVVHGYSMGGTGLEPVTSTV